MILFIEPISKNIGMYVPAYPLPIMEIASFAKYNLPDVNIEIISIPMDYGLPLSMEGKGEIYQKLLKDISNLKPKGIGISCTAIAQAEEAISLCEHIKVSQPGIFIFWGGYFPTLYYEEIFSRTSAVDLIVIGEGEIPTLKIIRLLENGKNPLDEEIPNSVWKKDETIYRSPKGPRFNLEQKALLNLDLLRFPKAYDVLPYGFSRGCSFRCNFCMEEFIRPSRQEVPLSTIHEDINRLARQSKAHTLLISDALFKSFSLFPLIQSMGLKINFETRCDILDPAILPQIKDSCGVLALGFESASYSTLKRMNKVKDRSHFQKYLANTKEIFQKAKENEIPLMVFMIAGYPGDTEEDLEESLHFIKTLSVADAPGGYVFKIGECHVYPKTKTYDLALSLPDVIFDDDGVFGQNVVRQSSKDLSFETILGYTESIFNLSHLTPKLQQAIMGIMPFFRLPVEALKDDIIPDLCFQGTGNREIMNVQGPSLAQFRKILPELTQKYRNEMSGQRSVRRLSI
ncbi:MAG: B12-binding domain-containing radical SAM protein [Deltaproteobacteria bacterium]|nr:B12-binding domain-containing radical SAM protein [Deltaproteobacteria bacterium]